LLLSFTIIEVLFSIIIKTLSFNIVKKKKANNLENKLLIDLRAKNLRKRQVFTILNNDNKSNNREDKRLKQNKIKNAQNVLKRTI